MSEIKYLPANVDLAQPHRKVKRPFDWIPLRNENSEFLVDKGLVYDAIGHNHDYEDYQVAARFLSGSHGENTPEQTRNALLDAGGDPRTASLYLYGFLPSKSNFDALDAVVRVSGMNKAEGPEKPLENLFQRNVKFDVGAAVPDAIETADIIDRALKDDLWMPVFLAGRHTAGSIVAKDNHTKKVYLLKTGSGGQSPALGLHEGHATASRREAVFSHIADIMGLSDYVLKADLLVINGDEIAAMELVPWGFKSLESIRKDDPGFPAKFFQTFLSNGTLHKWAAMDYILGNTDRHGQNFLIKDGEVRLIDHGASMAGSKFSPATDRYSFVPYYLRAWDTDFAKRSQQEKLARMPRVSEQMEKELRQWADALPISQIQRVAEEYGFDSTPIVTRLLKIRTLATTMPIDLAINSLWVK